MANYFTPIANGQLASAANFNAPLNQLDAVLAGFLEHSLGDFPFRLSLSSTLHTPLADIAAAATLYLHPYRGNRTQWFDGVRWNDVLVGSALSVSLASVVAGTAYDVFLTPTPSLVLVAWTNANLRAVPHQQQNFIPLRGTDASHRYVGSFIASGNGICEDSKQNRLLWNFWNRVPRAFRVTASASHTHTSASWRGFNNAVHRLQYFCGYAENPIIVDNLSARIDWATGNGAVQIGAGLNITNNNNLDSDPVQHGNGTIMQAIAHGILDPLEGYNAVNITEFGNANSPTFQTARMTGFVMA